MKSTAAIGVLLLLLPACDNLGHIGRAPPMTAPGTLSAVPPPETAGAIAASSMNHAADAAPARPGSIWRSGSRTFFRDQRARTIGDLVTVEIEIDDSAQFENRTQLSREAEQGLRLPLVLGAQGAIGRAIGAATGTGLDPAIEAGGSSSTTGSGAVRRNERIRLQVAATVVKVLPNGNFEIAGSQEIRVNDELRDLQVRGIVRPEDIRPTNRVSSDKIAEARISYGGRGVSSDQQRPRWGQQLLDRISPM